MPISCYFKDSSMSLLYKLLVVLFLVSQTIFSQSGSIVIQYLYPKPNSSYIPPEATFILRLENMTPGDINNIDSIFKVRGDISGTVRGKIKKVSDGRTLNFIPDKPFEVSETVMVQLNIQASGRVLDTLYSFEISSMPESGSLAEDDFPPAEPVKSYKVQKKSDFFDPVVINGISIPSDFPWVEISIDDNPDTGYIFLNNWDESGGQPYDMILDNSGAPIWYLRTPDRRRDFKVQKNGKLSMLIRGGYDNGSGHIVLDSTYTVVDVLHAGAGYATDEHELQILADGHYFVIGIRNETVDMSQIVDGGRRNANVSVGTVQEFTPNHELILNVPAWDLYDIADTQLENLTGGSFRFPHLNAIDVDDDGNILVSARHMSEVTKLNRTTGEIIWRLGGAHSDFTFVNDELDGFRNQHDIRSLGNKHYTVFDNGNLHNPPVSRSVEYELDTNAMTATLVWEFRDTPDKYTPWMGNTQRLPNGNILINWADGSLPKLTEVRPNGSKAFEMNFVDYIHCYRLFRFPWHGIAKIPYLIIEPNPDRITLLFNKFGDKSIDHYNIYADTREHPTSLVASTEQPFIHLTDFENGQTYWFRVRAVDSNGTFSNYSNEEALYVNIINPGTNLLFNPGFESGIDNWHLVRTGSAAATGGVKNGYFNFDILNGGTDIGDIQLYQENITLIQGREYKFEFDAWADQARAIGASVGKASDPFTDYSKLGLTALSTERTRYQYTFTMEDPSDQDCRVVISCGMDDANVYLDDVLLTLNNTSDTSSNHISSASPNTYQLYTNYPNPFNSSTRIRYAVPEHNHIQLSLFDLNGRFIQTIEDRIADPGEYEILFEPRHLSSGIYFIELIAANRIYQARKIIYLK